MISQLANFFCSKFRSTQNNCTLQQHLCFKDIVMKTLQLEIYNTILGKQSTIAFEQWLYNQESLLDKLNENTFLYDIFTINYKQENSLSLLERKAITEYGEDFKTVLFMEQLCIDITQKTSLEAYYKILKRVMIDFDYEQEYILFWKLFDFYDRLDLIFSGYGYETEDIYQIKIQSFAEKTIIKLQNCTSFEDKKAIIYKERIPFEQN